MRQEPVSWRQDSPRRPWLFVTLIVGAFALVAVVLIARRERPYDLVALSLTEALFEGDTNFIYRHMFAEEVQLGGYDREKVSAVWSNVIGPTLEGSKIVGTERDLGETYGSATRILRLPDGRRESLQVIVYATEEGLRMLFSSQILSAWHRKYRGETSANGWRLAVLAGLRTDRQSMESSDVAGLVDFEMTSMLGGMAFEIDTWQELEETLVAKINDQQLDR